MSIYAATRAVATNKCICRSEGNAQTSGLKPFGNTRKSAETDGRNRKNGPNLWFGTKRPRGKDSMTAGGGNIIGSFFNRNERSARWAVATIEVAGKRSAIIPPLIFLRFRVFHFWRICRVFPVYNAPGCSGAARHDFPLLKIYFRIFP